MALMTQSKARVLDFVRRNLSTSIVLGAFLSIAVLELSAVLYLWSDGYTSIAPHCKAIAELGAMARMAFAFLGGAACAVIAMGHAMKGDGRGVIFAVAVPTIVVLGFPVMGSAERAIQRSGANRIARRAEPLIEAIAAYEEAHGQLGHLDVLTRAKVLRRLPSPGVRGAGDYQLQSYSVGEWQLLVVVPVHQCSYALMVRAEPRGTGEGDFADGGWWLRCS
jgi:hypothetical protein